MSAGDWIGLFGIVIFAVFVGIIAIPVFKLGRLFEELRKSVSELTDSVTPTLNELKHTVAYTNKQIEKIDVMTTNIADASANLSALSSLLAATLGKPLIKVSAFSYAIRKVFRKQKETFSKDAATTKSGAAEQPAPAAVAHDIIARPSEEKAAYMLREANPQFFTAVETKPSVQVGEGTGKS